MFRTTASKSLSTKRDFFKMTSKIKKELEPNSGKGLFITSGDMINNQNFEHMVEQFYIPNQMY